MAITERDLPINPEEMGDDDFRMNVPQDVISNMLGGAYDGGSDAVNIYDAPLADIADEQKRLTSSAKAQLAASLQPTELTRENKVAGMILPLAMMLIGGAMKGKRGLSMGGQAGAVGAATYFGDIEKEKEKEREAAKTQALLDIQEARGLNTEKRQLQMKQLEYPRELAKDARAEQALARQEARDARIEQSMQNTEEYRAWEKAARIDEENRRRAEQSKNAEEQARKYEGRKIDGMITFKDSGNEEDFKKFAAQAGAARTLIEPEIGTFSKLKAAIKAGDSAAVNQLIAEAIMQRKDMKGMGANFTALEASLVKAGLPKDMLQTGNYLTDSAKLHIEQWLRGEDPLRVVEATEQNVKDALKIEGLNRGYAIKGMQYSPLQAKTSGFQVDDFGFPIGEDVLDRAAKDSRSLRTIPRKEDEPAAPSQSTQRKRQVIKELPPGARDLGDGTFLLPDGRRAKKV